MSAAVPHPHPSAAVPPMGLTGFGHPVPTWEMLPPVQSPAAVEQMTLPKTALPPASTTTPAAPQPELAAPAYIPSTVATTHAAAKVPSSPAETPPQATLPLPPVVSQTEPVPLPETQKPPPARMLPTATEAEDSPPLVNQPNLWLVNEDPPPPVRGTGTDPTPIVSEPENPGILADPQNELLPLLNQRKPSALTTTTFDPAGTAGIPLAEKMPSEATAPDIGAPQQATVPPPKGLLPWAPFPANGPTSTHTVAVPTASDSHAATQPAWRAQVPFQQKIPVSNRATTTTTTNTLSSNVGNAVGNAVQALQSAAASAVANVLYALDKASSAEPSSAPIDGSYFGLVGGGQTSSGANSAPILLLVGVILAFGVFLLRRDGLLWWVSYELLKPSSALLRPLERPG